MNTYPTPHPKVFLPDSIVVFVVDLLLTKLSCSHFGLLFG